MRDLHPLRLKLFNELDHLLDVVQVLAVHDQVHRKCKPSLLDLMCQLNLVCVTSGTCNPVRRLFLRVLETELYVIKPSLD